ncbi:LOW QUALITY PROTEIN: Beta-lactamase family protein, related [Eimeria mitis]|uniref:Beta-lactamase family protein, related n=1 Tax=Eimeria mitis TaxID=44415 RepID=U6K0F2_9EIME|nr:LOW QUALITY PROTEIN: Beta-lactamase family protein, related [Eimeria mitis]CDJ31169.1 Beta-lactamase family protein, related [Eimeria mitis]
MENWNRKWRTLWCWSNVYLGWKVAQARSRALPQDKQAAYWEQRHEHFANLVWDNIKELKGWWVKVGQFLSTRSDLLPQQYIHHLIKLQDMMPTTPYAVIEKALETELGDLSQIFSKIEEKPLASASIGQVHRAWLTDGTAVVVKVQHADVESLLMHDMANLKQLSWAFGLLEQGMNFAPILEEWQKAASKELDFRFEYTHQTRAYEAAQRSGIGVIIPKCYPNLVTKSVMVMEFIDGFKVTDVEKLDQYGVDRRELMYKLCDSFAYQIHIDGLFNGDPHPGNILVSVDPETREAKPVILDWGLVKEFDSKGQTAFSKLVYSVASMDVMGLMEAFEHMGFTFKEGKGAVVDPEIYMEALRVAFRQGEVEKNETEALHKAAGETVQAAVKAGITRKKIQEANPLEDWPKDIIFFVRVASLLHGLCVQLKVHIPFLQIMVRRAQECLFNRYQPPSPLIYTHFLGGRGAAKCSIQQRLNRLLRSLVEQKLVLGCQVAVCFEGEMIIDAAIGQMGPVDTRPVTPDSLFCGYCTAKGLLSTALLQLVSSGELELDDAVSSWWDGFIRYGKREITVQQLLTHRAGLHRALPADLTLSRLADYSEMVRIVEDAAPACPPGACGRYAYLTYGWAVSELVRCVSGMSIDAFVQERLLEPLGLKGELFIRVPREAEQSFPAVSVPQTPASAARGSTKSTPTVKPTTSPSSPSARQRSTDSMRMVSSSQQAVHVASTLELRHSALSKERGPSPLAERMAAAALSGNKAAVTSSGRSKTLESLNSSHDVLTTTHASDSADGESQQHSLSDRSRSFLLPGPHSSRRDGVDDAAYNEETRGRSITGSGISSKTSSRSPQLVSTPKTEEFSSDRESSRDPSAFSPALERSAAPSAPPLSRRHLDADDGASDRSKCSRSSSSSSSSSSKCSASVQGISHSAEKGQLSAFPKEVEIVTADTPLLWRLTSARRKISFNPMTQQEVLERLKQTQGKLEGEKEQGEGGVSSAYDRQVRRHLASAMRRRRRRMLSMKGNSGPLEHMREVHICNTRSTESLPDVFLRTRNVRHVDYDRQKSEEEGGLSQSDAFTEGLRTPESDSDSPGMTPTAPGAAPRVSVLELIRTKPHVMDPLIYDSHRIVHQLIPPSNCRCTARALARFYAALGEGQIISKPLLDAARVAHTVDTTLEALLLTGGGSRTWGLGYQLPSCAAAYQV